MTLWDAEAQERLEHITASFRDEGVLSLLNASSLASGSSTSTALNLAKSETPISHLG